MKTQAVPAAAEAHQYPTNTFTRTPGATARLLLCLLGSIASPALFAVGQYTAGALATAGVSQPGAAGASVTTYVPYSPMPAHDNARMRWITSEVALVKDNHGGDLVAFFRGDTTLHGAVSPDDGDSWAWVDPIATIGVAMPNTIAQSSDGKLHVLSDTGDLSYSRLLLQRNPDGHVTGFSAEVIDLPLPATVNFGELRTQIIDGIDQNGNETLFYAVYDWASSGTDRARIQAGRTSVGAGTNPTAAAQFVSLSNSAGSTVLVRFGGADWFASPHNNGVQMAQHPLSKDLYLYYGPLDTGDTSTQNTYPIQRLRVSTSANNTWTLSGTQIVDGYSGGYASQIGPAISTANAVWYLRISSAQGVVIDRVGADGSVTNPIASPYGTPHLAGWTAFAMNQAETQAWVGGWISYDSAVDGTARWAAHWEQGSGWMRAPADTSLSDTNGMGRSAGWEQGLVLMMLDTSSSFPYSGAPSFATIRTTSPSSADLIFADSFE